jgi:hypothetical protein
VRAEDSRAYALLNDTQQPVPPGVAEAFRRYEIKPVPWTDRLQVVQELVA